MINLEKKNLGKKVLNEGVKEFLLLSVFSLQTISSK